MMNRFNKEIDEYLSEIRKNLLCTSSQKKAIINDLRAGIVNFIDENNIDDFGEVYAQFGTPQDIANQSVYDTEPQKIKKNFNHHKVVIIGVVVAVLIVAVVIIWAALDGHKAVDGYFVDSLESIEATVINSSTQNIN